MGIESRIEKGVRLGSVAGLILGLGMMVYNTPRVWWLGKKIPEVVRMEGKSFREWVHRSNFPKNSPGYLEWVKKEKATRRELRDYVDLHKDVLEFSRVYLKREESIENVVYGIGITAVFGFVGAMFSPSRNKED